MGWTPVNNISLVRDFVTRKIVVSWHDEMTGDNKEEFEFTAEDLALELIKKLFKERCM